MTPASLRVVLPVRLLRQVTTVLERLAAPPLPPDWPSHDQLRETRERHRYAAASPHILAVGGRIDVIRLPR